tara:strand:+ start:285 stop:1133 length:849 start_codon:yes stop_codon:yes gene_type:complete
MDKKKQQINNPGLYIVSTPIGNMEDVTIRAINILKKSHVILCEDTRRSAKLLTHFNIKNKLKAYHKFNEKKVSDEITDIIKNENIVSLISDAGTPAISDPGLIIIKKCIEKKINIFPIPGVSAVTTAVSVSGFKDKYLFYGFLSKKENELENTLKNLCNLNYSIVFFIPATKINYYIIKFKKYFSDRSIVIGKEMTKIYEEFIRSEISSIKNFNSDIKGELTVVLSEKINSKFSKKTISESVKIEIKKMIKKYSIKDVVEFISKKENLSKKSVYDFCLKLKK